MLTSCAAKRRTGPRRLVRDHGGGARSDRSGAGRGAGSSRTSGHASLARRRLPLIACSYYGISCPGGEPGLAWVLLAPGLRRETGSHGAAPPKPSGVGGTESASTRAPREGVPCGPPASCILTPRGFARARDPSPGNGRVDAGQGLVLLPAPTGRGADGGELTARQLAGQTQLHQVLSGRGDACPGRQSICGHIPRTGFRQQ